MLREEHQLSENEEDFMQACRNRSEFRFQFCVIIGHQFLIEKLFDSLQIKSIRYTYSIPLCIAILLQIFQVEFHL